MTDKARIERIERTTRASCPHAAALVAIAKQGYLSRMTTAADAIKVADEMVDVAKAALRPPSSCTHEEQTSRLVAAIEPFRKYIELRYAIFSEHALDSIPTLQVSHAGRFGVSAAEITKADWDRIRYVLVPDIGVCEEAGDK